LLSAFASLWLLTAIATAQGRTPGDDPNSGLFLTPFPENDIYRVHVFGDTFAEGLAFGLTELINADPRVQVARRPRYINGLVRAEWEDDIRTDEGNKDLTHIGVVMLGMWDRTNLRLPGGTRPLPVGSDEWRAEYGRRADRLLQSLKKRRIAVYVVGLPVLRAPNDNARGEMLSEVLRQRAAANGVKYIDIYDAFQEDGDGGYAQWGPDMSGARARLREGDGVMFAPAGNRKLAALVEKEMRRDIESAVADRAVPLAGDELEQRRVNPAKATAAVSVPSAWKGSVNVGGPKGAATALSVPVGEGAGDQKAETGRVAFKTLTAQGREETVTLDLPRPALSAAVVAMMARREAIAGRGVQPGEPVSEDVGNGLVVINAVSQVGDGAQAAASQRRTAASQTPYQLVVVRGEALPPRAGRADDFSWPRTDAIAPSPPVQPASAPGNAPAPAPAASPPARQGLPNRGAEPRAQPQPRWTQPQ
jgi:lysophospholipase L1-like esterase